MRDKATRAAYMREWNRRNRGRKRVNDRKGYLKYEYGISVETYDELFRRQGGTCAICRRPETRVVNGKMLRLAVDHCHESTAVRGLLCYACNVGIGFLRHDPLILEAAASYVAKVQ